MQTSISAVYSLLFTLAVVAACDDPEDFLGDPDDPTTLRCTPPNCYSSNSPYIGSWNVSNLPAEAFVTRSSPDGSATMYWQSGTIHSTPEGRLTMSGMSIVGRTLTYTITANGVTTSGHQLKFLSEEIPSGGTYFNVPRYQIGTSVPPADPIEFPLVAKGLYSVCPQSEEGTKAVVLKGVKLSNAPGDIMVLVPDNTNLVIACMGHALGKPATQLEVLPTTNAMFPYMGGQVDRGYGPLNYSGTVEAFRAFFDHHSWTVVGTEIHLRDEAHSPRWFDQTTSLPPPPVIGYYTYVPESVYHYVSGAECYYTDANFPEGAHRRPEYDPPGAAIPQWNSLPDCGAQSQWAGFGNVSVHTVRHIIPGDSNF